MISLDEALRLIDSHRPDYGVEDVSLFNARGRELQNDVFATFTQPAVATSVMDGYAFRKVDVETEMIVVGESRAGEPFQGRVGPQEAVRIFTGAQLPDGLNQVEIQEYAVREGPRLTFSKVSKGRDYIRPAGSDFETGDLLFQSGQYITPAVISVLASANLSSVSVKRRPKIAILRCGDELKPVGSNLQGAQIVDSNGPYLASLLLNWGFDVVDLGLVSDDPKAIQDVISSCTANIIIPVGGASVGNYDYMKSAFVNAGFEMVFDKVAVKPGKPVWLARKDRQLTLGLPGNPHSVFVSSYLFLSYILGRDIQRDSRSLTNGISENAAREHYIFAKINANGSVTPFQRSAGLGYGMAKADALIRRVPFADAVKAGDFVECLYLI